MFEIFEKSKIEKSLINVWEYGDDSFYCGYILDYNHETNSLKHFTKYGKPDGVIIKKVQDIMLLDYEDDYLKSLGYVIENESKLEKDNTYEFDLVSLDDNWQYKVISDYIGNKENLGKIILSNQNSYSGFVLWCDDSFITLNLISNEGQDQGKSILKIKDISIIRVNDLDSRRRLLLYNWKNKK